MTYRKRGVIWDKILEKLGENPMTLNELKDALNVGRTTVSDNLERLMKESYVEKMGGYNAKYRLINYTPIADSKKVDALIKMIEECGDSKEVWDHATSDLMTICRNHKITKPEHWEYLMKKAKTTERVESYSKTIDRGNRWVFFHCICSAASILIKDHNIKLRGLLEKSLDLEYL